MIRLGTCFSGVGTPEYSLDKLGFDVDSKFAVEIADKAREIYLANSPFTDVFATDIKEFDATPWAGQIDLFVGGSPCFVAGTMILTDSGYVPIECVKVGDVVMTHTGMWQRVLSVGGTTNKTLSLVGQGVETTRVTNNHPYYVRERVDVRRVKSFNPPEWINAGDLIKGKHYLGLKINDESVNKHNLTKEECYVMGRYIADGYTAKNYKVNGTTKVYKVTLCLGKGKLDRDISKLGNLSHTVIEERTSYKVHLHNKRLYILCELLGGVGAINKEFHPDLLRLPKDLLQVLFDGYMDGDGCSVTKGDCIHYEATSISEKLILSMGMVVAKLYNTHCGFEYTKRPPTTVIEGRLVNQQDTYTARFRKYRNSRTQSYVDDGYIWRPIRKINNDELECRVYNLEVAIDNSYIANNAIVHNCQSFSTSGKRLGFEDTRGTLFFEYARLLKECDASVFVYENVKGLTHHDKGRTFATIINVFEDMGYSLKYQIVNTKDYGVPQHRERIYIIGVKGEHNPFEFPAPTGCETTVYDHLEDEVDAKYMLNKEDVLRRVNSTFTQQRTDIVVDIDFSRTLCSSDGRHCKSIGLKGEYYVTPEQVLKRIDCSFETDMARVSVADVSPTLMAGDGKNVRYIGLKHTHDLQVNTHDSRKRIYDASGACPTLTTSTGGYHEVKICKSTARVRDALARGVQFRKLTPREYFRLQGFDDDFILPKHITKGHLYTAAGNSMSRNILDMIFRQLDAQFLI